MILYHGTNSTSILSSEMRNGTWLAKHRFHAFRIAERRCCQRGGNPVVFEVETNSISRVEGRDNPTYKFIGGEYKILAIHKMIREEIK